MAIPKFPELEEQILKDWKEKDIFQRTLTKAAPKGNFVFFDGPPTANGIPHIGHVETRAFKDIIPRFKTMRGYHVERKAGWDTQGLPVELEVEKELGISGKKDIEKFGIAAFNAKAKESVWKYKDLWEKMTNRVGFWLDTDHPYITYQPEYIETLWWIFKQTWEQKLLVQDYKVVPYCPRCGTALSSHEVAQGYQNVEEDSVYVKFELVDEPGTFVLAWTTTPWTLPGNVALAIHPKLKYVKTEANEKGERYIFALPLFEKVQANVLKEVRGEFVQTDLMDGSDLVGKKYQPLFDFLDLRHVGRPADRNGVGAGLKPTPTGNNDGGAAYTIVGADFVTTEDGTGVVHTAVMYGEDDFKLGQKLDLPKVHTVDLQGKFTDLVKPWAGLEVKDPRGETQQKIIAWLEEQGKLYKVEKYKHDYPFCWRCKHPLLYYAKTSWFIQMSKLREQLIKNNEQINWYPAHIKDGRFGEWLREVKDWAISRERYWGTPIPIWQCDNPDCQHQECLGSYQELLEQLPTRNRYFFVRHGESVLNIQKILNTELMNAAKYPLTDTGKKEAMAGAKTLATEKIVGIFSSQFTRAKETADVYADVLKVPVVEDARLNEYHIGPAFEEKSLDEFHRSFGDRAKRVDDAPPGGETWKDIRQRMIAFLAELDARYEGKTFVIVTHADPILVTKWAVSLQSVPTLTRFEDVPYGRPEELKFHAQVLQTDGSFDPHRPFIDEITWECPKCGPSSLPPGTTSLGQGGRMRRIPEVADAWFDSGAMPFAQWHYPFENADKIDQGSAYPADFISEAIDQTRGWFYTLLAISTLLQHGKVVKKPSYTNVVVLGLLNDAQGRKLSKSLKNYGDLDELFSQHGADALRWFMYTTNQPWDPKNFDVKLVDEGVKKTFLILLNVVSFWQLYPQTTSADPRTSTHPLDRWVLSELNQVVAGMTTELDAYNITAAARRLGDFVTELSTWFVRRSRDRFKTAEAPMASAVLREVLLTVSKLLAPFTPFLAEHVYRTMGGSLDSVHLESWPEAGQVDERLLTDMSLARTVVEQALALRAKAGVKIRQPLAQLVVTTALRPELDEIVRQELNVKELHATESLPFGGDWLATETVALDISISDELREEGYLRDLVRECNALRKKAGLTPGDAIIVHCPPNTLVAKLIEQHQAQFFADVRARAATPSLDGATTTGEINLDGQVTIGLSRA